MHFYGPYSATLDASTASLSADGIVEFDYSGYSHLMSIDEDNFSIEPEKLSKEELCQMDQLIQRFKGQTASELELLTTAIYAYDHVDERSKEAVIKGVQKIKGSKYSNEHIQRSLEHFEFFGKTLA